MTNAIQNVQKVNAGTCPHGLPPSACPVCSNMGGGGSLRVGERPQKAGEMSYHQCAMLGALMKSREQRIETHEKNLQARAEALIQFQNSIQASIDKIQAFINQISNTVILKPIAFVLANTVLPILNLVKNLPNIITNFINKLSDIKQKFIDIQDKLNAIFGEAKAFLDKKVSEFISAIKSKFNNIFKVFKKDNTNDDDTKIDDDKKIFNLKTIIHKILNRKKKDDTEDESRR